MDLETGDHLGRYEITGSLGRGGMGQVYRARDRRLGRTVAIKVLSAALASDPVRIERFEREARAASMLNHPNVLVIFDIGNEKGTPFLVTEILEGESLRETLRRGEDFTAARAVHYALRIAQGLSAAHDKGIVHRDLKPENIFLLHDGRLKILDFGLAKLRYDLAISGMAETIEPSVPGHRLTATGMLMGTVGYMSPEQAAESEADYRADQFALGVVMYEMLSGRRPFQRPTQVQTLAAVIEAAPEPLEGQGLSLPVELVALVERMLEKEPGERYDSTHDIVTALEALADREGVTSSTITPVAWARRPSARRDSGGRRCPRCSHRNEASNRFCGQCGTALAPPEGSACPSCGHHVSGSGGFCEHCGYRLSGSGSVPVQTVSPLSSPAFSAHRASTKTPSGALFSGERRQATVGVSLISGYDDLVEQLPPGEVEEIIDRVRKVAAAIVTQNGGLIHRFTGEEMVVLFGAPKTREDDSVRAVFTFRELHDRLEALADELRCRTGQALELRSGIDTGWVVTQLVEGTELWSVTGEALKRASSLAHRAHSGEILLSPETRRLVAPLFETKPGKRVFLQGQSRPLVPYHVIGKARRRRRFATHSQARIPFFGRGHELESLRAAVAKARGGQGQFVVVTGEAGSGKSRLLFELEKGLAKEKVEVLHSSCQGIGECFSTVEAAERAPFIEALREGLGWSPGEAMEQGEAGSELARRIHEIDPDLEHLIPFYLHLLGVASDEYPVPKRFSGRHLEHVLNETLAVFFTAYAQKKPWPTVLMLESWHGSDEGSRALLEQLLEMVPAHPLLIVLTHRPEERFEWGRAAPTTITLGPLSARSSGELLGAVAGVDSFPSELTELLHEKTGGIPFFLEEMCRAMVETGRLATSEGRVRWRGSSVDLELPATVQAVVRARLDRLEGETREAVRRLSVLGYEFTRGLLELTAPDPEAMLRALETMRELGLIQQTRALPEPTFRFRNALIRDVAYESLLQHQRRSLHGRVGEVLETSRDQSGGSIDEENKERTLAYHMSRAHRWEKAVGYALVAVGKAERQRKYSEAVELCEEIRTWLQHDSEGTERKHRLIDLLFRQERLSGILGDPERQRRALDDLLDLLDPETDRAQIGEVHRRAGELATLRGRFFDAQRALSEALRTARERRDEMGERNAWRSIGFLRWYEERYGEALEANRAALAIDRRCDDPEAVAFDLMNLGSVERNLGRHEKGRAHLLEASEIFARLNDRRYQIEALYLVAVNYRDQNDHENALRHLEEAKKLSLSLGARSWSCHQLALMGNLLIEDDREEEALECYREAVEASAEMHSAHGLSRSLLALGDTLLALGHSAEALAPLRRGAALFERSGERRNAASAWSKAARCAEELGDPEAALKAWHRTHTLRQATHDLAGEIEALEGMARVSRSAVAGPHDPEAPSRLAAAARYCESALHLARRLRDRTKQGALLNTLGILDWSRGSFESALRHYAAALQLFRELGDEVHAGLILNSMGATLGKLGWYEEALTHLEEAREVNRKTGEWLLLSHSLAALGEIHRDLKERGRAVELFEASLALRRDVGDLRGEGWMCLKLAELHHAERSNDAAPFLEAAQAAAQDSKDENLAKRCRKLLAERS